MRAVSTSTGLAAIAVLVSLPASSEEPPDPLHAAVSVGAGRHVVIHVPAGTRSVGSLDSRVVHTQLLSDTEALLTGVMHGETTIVARGRDGTETTFDVTVDASSLPTPDPKPAEILSLGVGHQKTFVVSDIRRVAIGDPKVADVSVIDGKEILLTGVAPGRTSLLIWRGRDVHVSYVVSVEEKPIEDYANEIRQLLGLMEGIRLRVIGERIFLDGEVETKEDGELVKRVCDLYPQVLVCL